MTKAKKITVAVMVVSTTALIGWDVVVASNKERGDTISEILLHAARHVPIVAVAWGVLTGHLFWSQGKGQGYVCGERPAE